MLSHGESPHAATKNEGEPLMHKEDASTLCALMAGATVGASLGLLFAPQVGSQVRSSLREYTIKAKNQGEATNDRTQSSVTQEAADEEGSRNPGAEGGGRSAQKDHATGDTGQDN